MRRTLLLVVGGVAIATFGAACTSDDEPAATATSTVVATATEATTATAEASATPEMEAAADGGQMLAALLLIDGAGFHGMDEALNGASPAIDASWLGATQRAHAAAAAIAWPEEMHPAVDAFVEATTALEAALDADDAAGAAPLATAVHDAQHELSHMAYDAIEAAPASASDGGGMLAALSLIDGAGFHGMDEGLNGASPAIDAAWVGATQRARIAAQTIAWTADVQPAADAFIDAAVALEAALEADDAVGAAPLATAAHETQHELSHGAYDALAEMAASAGSPGAMLAALTFIDGAGFHGMDEALNGASPAIDAQWLGKVTRARVAAETIAWPDDVQPAADAFIDAAVALEAALDADDAAGAAPLATAAHETQHELSHGAYAYLGGGDAH